MKDANLSQRDLLLLAMADLEAKGKSPVHMNDLVVAAWKADKGVWGLAGFEGLYPHSNAVNVCLSTGNGPIAKGWMERPWPGTGLLRLTDAGRERAAELSGRVAA